MIACASAQKIIGYYGEWSIYGHNFPVSSINTTQLTHIHYSFMVPNPAQEQFNVLKSNYNYPINPYNPSIPEGTLVPYDGYAVSVNIPQLKTIKRNNPNIKIIIAIGGWTGSSFLSKIFADPVLRTRFVQSSKAYLIANGFDGIDLDWEYPVRQGIGFNIVSSQDGKNLALVTKEFKEAFTGTGLTISIAMGCSESNLDTYRESVPFFDYIGLMTYDIAGDWLPDGGHQSPFYYNSKAPMTTNVQSTIDRVVAMGVPASKLVIGSPLYGRGWNQCTPKNAAEPIFGTCTGRLPLLDPAGSQGMLDYRFLKKRIANYDIYYDTIAQASYAYSPSLRELWTYDNDRAVLFKVNQVKAQNLGGIMFWDVSADDGLVDIAVRNFNRSPSPVVPTPSPVPVVPTPSPVVPTPSPVPTAQCVKLYQYCANAPCCRGMKCVNNNCAIDPLVDPQCANPYEQCGGQGFKGPTCCKVGATCKVVSAWYSGCAF